MCIRAFFPFSFHTKCFCNNLVTDTWKCLHSHVQHSPALQFICDVEHLHHHTLLYFFHVLVREYQYNPFSKSEAEPATAADVKPLSASVLKNDVPLPTMKIFIILKKNWENERTEEFNELSVRSFFHNFRRIFGQLGTGADTQNRLFS